MLAIPLAEFHAGFWRLLTHDVLPLRACLPGCPRARVSIYAVLPSGYFLKGPGIMAACPKGEYKFGVGSTASCKKCAFGVTTAKEASASVAACTGALSTLATYSVVVCQRRVAAMTRKLCC
jgi:hypothetical protein